jgi:A/G-specific adenine glycosylase
MDYGAGMPGINPNRRSAHYKKQSSFKDSDRRLRGMVLRRALSGQKKSKIPISELFTLLAVPRERFEKILGDLEKEGFIVRKGNYICIK